MDSQTVPLSLAKSPSAIAVPALAFFAFLLSIPPFVVHVKGRNLAAATLIFWVTIFNLFSFINALIWPTDDIASWLKGAGLCDIEVKLQDAAGVGNPGALACIFRQLAIILDTERTVLAPSRKQRRNRLILEIVLCIVFPAWMFIAQYIVQTHRYYIFAIAGCNPVYSDSWLTIVLIFVWPLVLCVLDLYYCAIVIYRLILYRRQFSSILNSTSSTSNRNRNRFIRLFAMSLTFLAVFLPVNVYIFARNIEFARQPFSWSDVHGPGWNEIIEVPTNGAVVFDRWVQIGVGLAVFGFFGLGRDAVEMYRGWMVGCGLGRFISHGQGGEGSSGGGKSSSSRGASISVSAGSSSIGEKLGSQARTMFRFHRRSRSQRDSDSDTLDPSLLAPLPLYTSPKNHLTPAFGSTLKPSTSPSPAAASPPVYRFSWRRGTSSRSPNQNQNQNQSTSTAEIKLMNSVFGEGIGDGDGRIGTTAGSGPGSGAVETRIWSEKKKKRERGLEMAMVNGSGSLKNSKEKGMGMGEVKVVREIVQTQMQG